MFSLQERVDVPRGRVLQHDVRRMEVPGSLDLHLGCLQSFGDSLI